MTGLELTVSQFVDIFNQTMEGAYPSVYITGELANFRISKNRWLYFDLKDESSTLKFFGTVHQLPGPLTDGMMLKVKAQPRLHHQYGFSLTVISLQPVGEGSIKKAAKLLEAKLASEGLFEDSRKRQLPYPPSRIGLITSRQAAAYADFTKIINSRWRGLSVQFIDVQVQGEAAINQIVAALEQFNAEAEPPEVVVLIRGGGSPEDLMAFSSEAVTRAVAASRAPTLVAIGHEIDLSLAELAADRRASTPSNAAELLVPDRRHSLSELTGLAHHLSHSIEQHLSASHERITNSQIGLSDLIERNLADRLVELINHRQLIEAFNPTAILRRGYSLVRDSHGQLVRSAKNLRISDKVDVQLSDGGFSAEVKAVK